MERHFEQALEYVRKNHTWSEAEEAVALERIDHLRCGLQYVDSSISEEIHDLMEEYGEEHDLPEEWWYEIGDEDDVFMKL